MLTLLGSTKSALLGRCSCLGTLVVLACFSSVMPAKAANSWATSSRTTAPQQQAMQPNAKEIAKQYRGQKSPLSPLAGMQTSPDPRSAPYAGHYNHAQQTPTYRWGWFGAEQFEAPARWHQSYSGNLVRWSEQR